MSLSGRVRAFEFGSRPRRLKIYFICMVLAFAYGVYNDSVLKRPPARITAEIALIVFLGTALAIALARPTSAPPVRRGVRGHSIIVLSVVAISALVMSQYSGAFSRLEVQVVNSRILKSLSDYDRAEEVFSSAQALRLPSDPMVRAEAAKHFLQASDPGAWKAVNQLLDYQSAITDREGVISVAKARAQAIHIKGEILGALVWMTSSGFTFVSQIPMDWFRDPEQDARRHINGTLVPAKIAAYLGPIGLEPISNYGPAYVVLGAEPDNVRVNPAARPAVRLDGLHARNIIFQKCLIVYDGDPMLLENVAFEDCLFDLRESQRSRELVACFIGNTAVSFQAD